MLTSTIDLGLLTKPSAVLPNANFGKILKPNGEGESSTGSWIVNLFKGDTGIYAFPPQWFVDVQDTARLHVAALVDPSANGKRIYAFAAPVSHPLHLRTCLC